MTISDAPPVELCPDWCTGHDDTDDPALPRHFSYVGEFRASLTGHTAVSIQQWGEGSLGAYLELDTGPEREPVRFTTSEARSLAAMLTRAADRLELLT